MKYFGTDGIRAKVGSALMNPRFLYRVGVAVGRFLEKQCGGGPAKVIIGRDTRTSGVELQAALVAGLQEKGIEVEALGVAPTPALAYIVKTSDANFGIMVTASHNPATDNGVKFFNDQGKKLTLRDEESLDQQMSVEMLHGDTVAMGAVVERAALEPYLSHVRGLLPAGALTGWTIAIDMAHGAVIATAVVVLKALGAQLIVLGGEPDGWNINDGVGSEHPQALCEVVAAHKDCLGIAFDGDGDRLVLVDEHGEVLAGEAVMAVMMAYRLENEPAMPKVLVTTVQSNLAIDAMVKRLGGRVERVPVGDRNVLYKMEEAWGCLGGESSGHYLFDQAIPCGDGLAAALRVIRVMQETGKSLCELRQILQLYPQVSENILVQEKRPLSKLTHVQHAVAEIDQKLRGRGRVLVRYSGTESKLRLLIESDNEQDNRQLMAKLKQAVAADLITG